MNCKKKCFIAFSGSIKYIKQHIKTLPTLKHHKGLIMMFKK